MKNHIYDWNLLVTSHELNIINACIARGGWVPRNLEAGAADPKPRWQEYPKSLAYPQPSHKPCPPYLAPAQAPVTQSQELHGSNNNSNNQ